MDIAGDVEAVDRLARYITLIVQWNSAYNLTAVRDPEQMVTRHLLDSLSILPYLHGTRLVDIGSGAGLPGIPLAIVRADLQLSLVEPVGKKARFLREAVRQLGLGDRVAVHAMRAEALAEVELFDCLVARALGSLEMIASVGGHLLRAGGRILAMKGQSPAEEIRALPDGYRLLDLHRLEVPGCSAERHLVVIERGGSAAAAAAS
jgi:16S rRNA (guanine527-N7)-methyltransferase